MSKVDSKKSAGMSGLIGFRELISGWLQVKHSFVLQTI